ncbi:hypothetical protein CHCC20442_4300 [Bacillus licheniformis]|nr:hypothetical protein CHCC20442_4300 [Bacillus licheniformis]
MASETYWLTLSREITPPQFDVTECGQPPSHNVTRVRNHVVEVRPTNQQPTNGDADQKNPLHHLVKKKKRNDFSDREPHHQDSDDVVRSGRKQNHPVDDVCLRKQKRLTKYERYGGKTDGNRIVPHQRQFVYFPHILFSIEKSNRFGCSLKYFRCCHNHLSFLFSEELFSDHNVQIILVDAVHHPH